MRPKNPKKSRRAADREHALQTTIEELELFAKWRRNVLPRLFKAQAEGKTAEEIYKEFAKEAAFRSVQIALTSPDAGKAMSAISDILNRSGGKPTEKVELEHKYSSLKDEELDALLVSKLSDEEDVDH